jgi:hypothetical protein
MPRIAPASLRAEASLKPRINERLTIHWQFRQHLGPLLSTSETNAAGKLELDLKLPI